MWSLLLLINNEALSCREWIVWNGVSGVIQLSPELSGFISSCTNSLQFTPSRVDLTQYNVIFVLSLYIWGFSSETESPHLSGPEPLPETNCDSCVSEHGGANHKMIRIRKKNLGNVVSRSVWAPFPCFTALSPVFMSVLNTHSFIIIIVFYLCVILWWHLPNQISTFCKTLFSCYIWSQF